MHTLVQSNQLLTFAPWIVAITGASGGVYGSRLIGALLQTFTDLELHIVISDAGFRVLEQEQGTQKSEFLGELLRGEYRERVTVHNNRDIGATIASGSYNTSGMVIVPCSMSSLAACASGLTQNLITRAADVTLKEGRKLVLVPRETPLSAIHLENMLKLARLGVRVVPAMPGFYHYPKSVDDLVDHVVMRIMDQMGMRVDITRRWNGGRKEQ